MPVTATRQEGYARLQLSATEHEVAQRAGIAVKLGLDVTWKDVFKRIEKMEPTEREQIRYFITTEYHLPSTMPLNDIKKCVSWRSVLRENQSPL